MNNQTDTQDTTTIPLSPRAVADYVSKVVASNDGEPHDADEIWALIIEACAETYKPQDTSLCTYPPLPEPVELVNGEACAFTEAQMYAFVDADRTLRAGQSEPVAPTLIRDAAERALAAYQHRFESVAPPMGNFVGPIDEEMQALRAALRSTLPQTTGGKGS